jgi:hypothetical protein
VSRERCRQFESEHRNVKGRNADVSIDDTACGIPRGPGISIGIVSRLPTACPEGNRAVGLHWG